MEYYKMDDAAKATRLDEINKTIKSGDKFVKENLNLDLGKGMIESCSIFGTVAGLAILAPIVSHPLIHPILKAFKLDQSNANDKNNSKDAKAQQPEQPKTQG